MHLRAQEAFKRRNPVGFISQLYVRTEGQRNVKNASWLGQLGI